MTCGEIEDHLLRVMDYATDSPSLINPSLTKEDSWNIFMKSIINKKDTDDAFDMLVTNVYREFPNCS